MMGQESTHWTDLAETGGVALWDVDVMLDRDASISSGGPLGGDRVGFVSGWSSLSRVVAALVGNATLLSWCDEACSSALKEGGTEGPLAFGSPESDGNDRHVTFRTTSGQPCCLGTFAIQQGFYPSFVYRIRQKVFNGESAWNPHYGGAREESVGGMMIRGFFHELRETEDRNPVTRRVVVDAMVVDFDDHSQREGWMTPALMASWVGTTFGIISAFDFDSDPTWRREGYDFFSSMFGHRIKDIQLYFMYAGA